MAKCTNCGNDSSKWAGTTKEKVNCPKTSGNKCRSCTWAGNTRVKCCNGKCDGRGNELCGTCGGKGWRYTGNNILCTMPHDNSSVKRR
ncbi:hypothetical protein UCDDA912_g07312 [Diaporthe ampelina]|uniref:Uncharacterized protein n=1 Tax=Diaporthe ampelina TaxID=1214573 RepID=A0A0G2HXQ1_9PEZI|nr:hypothetical protein UCDDA912_g07312 [Diaporthe ampelina]